MDVVSAIGQEVAFVAQQTANYGADYDRSVSTGQSAMNMVVLDNIFVFLSAALVFLMQPGFALVEAGLTRAKNAANIMMKNLMDLCLGVLVFAVVGWGIAYPGGQFNGVLGSAGLGVKGLMTDWLVDISPEALVSDSFYPLATPVDFLFQAAFAAAAATIVSGAVAGRTKFVGYAIYSTVITGLIYPIVVSWKWGGGWLDSIGFIDFAGSGVVHLVGGVAALVGASVIGPRIGKYAADGKALAIPGHSMPLAITGVFILFIGWFGFNAGSQLQADMAVPLIAVLTVLSGTAGGVIAVVTSWAVLSKPDVSMAGNGLLAGLVAICSGVADVSAVGAVVIGSVAGLIVVLSVLGIERLGVDDPVGAFSVHGVAGAWGVTATGLFATVTPINGIIEAKGLLYGGGFGLLGSQLLAVVCIGGFTALAAAALFGSMKRFDLLRVEPADEVTGLDIVEHGSAGYGPDMVPASTVR